MMYQKLMWCSRLISIGSSNTSLRLGRAPYRLAKDRYLDHNARVDFSPYLYRMIHTCIENHGPKAVRRKNSIGRFRLIESGDKLFL